MVVARPDTRQILADSLVELCAHTPFNKISVQAIADNCGVSVRTFYNHFADKYDLASWNYAQAVRDAFQNTVQQGRPYYEMQLECIRRFVENSTYNVNVINNTHGRDSIRVAMHRFNHETFGSWLAQSIGVESADDVDPHLTFSLDLFLRGATEALIEWIENGMPVPPETLAHWIADSMPENIKPYFPSE